MSLYDYKHDLIVPRFDGTNDDGFHLCCMIVKAALLCKKILQLLASENFRAKITDQALSVIVSALG